MVLVSEDGRRQSLVNTTSLRVLDYQLAFREDEVEVED